MPQPHIIISDIMMDEMDGYEFISTLYQNRNFSHIPVIILSAKTTKDEQLQSLTNGAIDYISKPFSIIELKAKIKSIIRQQDAQNEFQIFNLEEKIKNTLRNKDASNAFFMNFKNKCFDYNLTSREIEVTQLLIKGLEYKEISNQLDISINTLKPYIRNIYRKFQVQNKVELINRLNNN